MHIKFAPKFPLRYTTVPTLMTIACSGSPRLSFPVRPAIQFASTAPRGILLSAHSVSMGYIETFFATVLVISVLDLVRLPTKYFVAYWTLKLNSFCVLAKRLNVRTHPRAQAFLSTKIMRLLRTWWNSLFFSAPSAYNYFLRISAFKTTVMDLVSVGVPKRTREMFSTSDTSYFFFHDDIISQMSLHAVII